MSAPIIDKNTVSDDLVSSDTTSEMIPVWDIVVRVFHWSLVIGFAAAWLTSEDIAWLHELIGYVVLGLIAVRFIWGFIGTKYARFSNFIKSPRTVYAYLDDMTKEKEQRYIGHNPAGGAMIIALLLGVLVTGVTGWMSTTDAYWGIRWVEIVHELSAFGVVALVAGHVIGVIYASKRHGENLAKAMVTGKKKRNL